jgi:hypothetical protein
LIIKSILFDKWGVLMLFQTMNPQLMYVEQQEKLSGITKAQTQQEKETGLKLNWVTHLFSFNKKPNTCCACACS